MHSITLTLVGFSLCQPFKICLTNTHNEYLNYIISLVAKRLWKATIFILKPRPGSTGMYNNSSYIAFRPRTWNVEAQCKNHYTSSEFHPVLLPIFQLQTYTWFIHLYMLNRCGSNAYKFPIQTSSLRSNTARDTQNTKHTMSLHSDAQHIHIHIKTNFVFNDHEHSTMFMKTNELVCWLMCSL